MNNRQERNRSRREFLAQTVACLAAIPSVRALGQQVSPEDAWNLDRRLILASHLFEDKSFFEIGHYFRELIPQSRQVDLWIDYAGNRTSRHFDEIRARGFAATRAYCDQLGIRLSTATCYGARGYAGYAEAIRDLGCTLCIQSSGKRTSGSITEMMKRELESYKPALELAEKYNCRIAIENHSGRHLLNDMDSFKAFMDLCEHPRLGIALRHSIPKDAQSRRKSIWGSASPRSSTCTPGNRTPTGRHWPRKRRGNPKCRVLGLTISVRSCRFCVNIVRRH